MFRRRTVLLAFPVCFVLFLTFFVLANAYRDSQLSGLLGFVGLLIFALPLFSIFFSLAGHIFLSWPPLDYLYEWLMEHSTPVFKWLMWCEVHEHYERMVREQNGQDGSHGRGT